MDRLGDQIVQEVQALGADPEGGKVAQAFGRVEGGGEELDQGLPVALAPSPDASLVQGRDGLELQPGEYIRQRGIDAILENQ